MPILTKRETRIRELHEDNAARVNRLVLSTAAALADHESIKAHGRIDRTTVPAILHILDLVPAIHADADAARRYNLRINGLYCQLASQRRQRSRRDDDPEGAALREAA
jgi:hypothetical protein